MREDAGTPTPGNGPGPIRLVVVDDHAVVREGLRAMLRRDERVAIVGEAEDLDQALAEIERTSPEIVLLDVRLQGQSGLDVCRTIVERRPDVKVVFLTVYEEDQYVFEALRVGARGYLLKRVSDEELVRALEAVRRGEVIVDPALTGQVAMRAAATRKGASWPGAQLGLTERESEVLQAMVRGLSNAGIGRELHISEETVKSHVRAVLRKLGVSDRTQAVALALKKGMVR
jgi:DNA-binding NarL/FixJ family response regulator